MIRRAALAGAALGALLLVAGAPAYVITSERWPTPSATFSVSIPGANGLWDQAFENALAIWNDARFTYYIRRGEYQNPCALEFAPIGVNGVKFAYQTCTGAFGSTTLAVEHSWTIGSQIVNSGIVFNSYEPWDVYSGPWRSTVNDFRRVAVHELGHSLGLGHEDRVPSIMSTYADDVERPTADDIAGVAALYGLTIPSPPSSAPTGVSATDGVPADAVRIQWNPVDRATTYFVLRGNSSSDPNPALVGAVTGTTFLDTSGAPINYWYAVQACNTYGCSPISAFDFGRRNVAAAGLPTRSESFEGSFPTGDWRYPSSADAGWVGTTDRFADGGRSFRSQEIGDNDAAAVEYQGSFPGGVLEFSYWIDSETTYDKLTFSVDGAERFSTSGGSSAWRTAMIPISAAPNTLTLRLLRWSFTKDGSISTGADAAWIDRVVFHPTAFGSAPTLYDPVAGAFYLRDHLSDGGADVGFSYGAANAGWIPLMGDWNGDGVDTVGAYDPSTSVFYLRNAPGGGQADVAFAYGPARAGWIPIAGDWNGDGIDTIALYDRANGVFHIRNSFGGGNADLAFRFGPTGSNWIPIAGNWDAFGGDTISLYDPRGVFYIRNSLAGGNADLVFLYGPPNLGWIPLAGDWDDNGADSVALYDPAASAFHCRNALAGGPADVAFKFGPPGLGWKPLAARF